MPLIHIFCNEGKSESFLDTLGDSIHNTLIETWGIPQDDRFHIIHEKKAKHMQIDKKMWGVNRSDDVILLNIVSAPRTKEMKLKFYERLPVVLNDKLSIRPEDVFISIVNNDLEDWSFGNGEAHLLK